MADANDSEVFMELAQGEGDGPLEPRRSVGSVLRDIRARQVAEDEEAYSPGQLVQYAHNGPGLMPTTATTAALPPAVYKFECLNDRWTMVPHRFITDDLLRLPDSKSDFVISEIERFWGLKPAYEKLGFTHKRGVLLFGPPGSGKTSTVAVITEKMLSGGGVMFLMNGTHPQICSMLLHQFRQVEPERQAVVVIEDIDSYIKEYGEQNVLSLLDGEESIDNVVYIATTNYAEELDGRITNRPSRFDRVIFIDTPNAASRKLYLQSRDLGLTEDEIDDWVDLTDDYSIAHLKELIIGVVILGGKLDDEAKRIRTMFKGPKNDNARGLGFGG